MQKLEELRRELGQAIIINSGFRCTDHNKEVGGKEDSWHLRFATDIRPEDGKLLHQVYKIALAQEWGGIGLYDSFVHLDCRPVPARWRG